MTARGEGPDSNAATALLFARILARGARGDLQRSLIVRAVILAAIGVVIVTRVPFPESGFYLAILLLFLAAGILHWYCASRLGKTISWERVFALLDVLLLAFALVCPNPLAAAPAPPQLALGSGDFAYFYLLLAVASLTCSVRAVLWTGLGAAVIWGAVASLLVMLPGTVTMRDYADWATMPLYARLDALRQPHFVDLPGVIRDIGLIALVALLLAWVVAGRTQRPAAVHRNADLPPGAT